MCRRFPERRKTQRKSVGRPQRGLGCTELPVQDSHVFFQTKRVPDRSSLLKCRCCCSFRCVTHPFRPIRPSSLVDSSTAAPYFEGQCASFVVLKFSKHALAAVACSAASIGIEGRFLDSWSKAHSRDRRAALQSHLRHWILAFCEVNGGCLGDLPAEAIRESNGIISEDLYIE